MKRQLFEALGEDGQVLIDLLPELERIIGPQLKAPELAPTAAQSRFSRLFVRFIRVFAMAAHPLVVFLDDLQWADSASLKILHLLTTEVGMSHLLVLGAYRDNEVSSTHPLMLTVEEIRAGGTRVHQATLAPLGQGIINELVADALSCSLEHARPLTQLIYQKAKGNPFFTGQYMKALHQEGVLSYDGAQPEKRLSIKAHASSPGRFRIVVQDNGVGVSEEHLSRVFQYGFSTRSGSRGFGLHWSANAAREMGGDLSASSDGPGRGATFVLDLPVGPS